jgi:hypothetical protein
LALTPQLWRLTQRCSRTAQENLALDNAFVLIDHIPLPFKEVIADVLKVKPPATPPKLKRTQDGKEK